MVKKHINTPVENFAIIISEMRLPAELCTVELCLVVSSSGVTGSARLNAITVVPLGGEV